jgi:acyl-CoA synthetase (AMP-forming)/AMP-acid ligase II
MTATGSAPHCESTLTMASALARAARLYPKRPAVLDIEGDLTWAQWVERIARAAAVLAGLGLRPGDRFAIIGRNSFRHAELINGAYWLGAIPVPINIRLAPPEMRHILDDAGCRLLALEDRYLGLHDDPHFAPWRARAMVFGRAPRSGTLPDYERLLAEARPAELHLARPADDAILLYTGGTTGRSKGVPLAHAHILANALQFGLATRAYAEDRYLHVSPLFHSGGLIGTVFTLVGGAHHYPSDISGRAMLEAIERHRLTITNMPPTVVFMMLEDPDIDRFDVSSLRLLFYGSAPMAPEWIKRAMTKFPNAGLQQGYGLTETSPILATMTPEQTRAAIESGDHERLLSVGKPVVHVELRVVDAEDRELAPGGVGEIVARGPNITRGYLGLAEQNAQTFRNGWFHTGDVGRFDEEGNLYVLDRMKDMIITGGENVYSSEVEAVLYKHPGVSEAAVVGVPDEKWGEAVFAVIVPAPGARLTPDEIIAHCRKYIGGYKIPRRMAFVDALPRSALGKVLKTELRKTYGGAR